MPLVVLEGADGSGKSTLANRLLKGTGHPTLLVKRSGPPGRIETLNFMTEWLRAQALSGLNIIADRHPIISECIYRPTVRKEGPAPWTKVEAAGALRGKGTLLIYCRTETAVQSEGSKVEEQMEGVFDNYVSLVAEYDRWFHAFTGWGLNIYRYDWQVDRDCQDAIAIVKSFWEENQ